MSLLPSPMPSYIMIKIERALQEKKKNKLGSIIIPETQRFLMYNMQGGGNRSHRIKG